MSRALHASFAALLVVWLGARLTYFNGYYTEDAPGYVSDAVAIALGEYRARNHVNGLNLGTYAPVAIPLWLFGKTDFALSVWPLLCSLLGMASIAAMAAMLLGRPAAVVAALLYATYPGDVFFSTVVMPDAIQSGWLSFSIFVVVLASQRLEPQRARLTFAAGAAMGVCHLIRANGALLMPIGLVAIAVTSVVVNSERLAEGARRCAVFMAGWLLVFALEGLSYWLAVGDFLFRFHVVDQHYGTTQSVARFGLNTNPLTIPYSLFAPLTWMRFGGWWTFNPDQAYHGMLFLLALIALAVGAIVVVVRRPRRDARLAGALLIALFWFAWPVLYHQFGSQSLSQFVPIHRLSRHLVVYAPGAIFALVTGGTLLWSTVSSRRTRGLLIGIAVPVLLLHLVLNVQGERIAYNGYHRIKDVYSRIRDHLPPDTRKIIADPGDLGFFDFWLNPLGEQPVQLHAFAMYPDCESLTDGVVLTYSNPGWERLGAPAIREVVARMPCLVQPPPSWRLLYDGFDEKIYVLPGGP